MPQPAVRLCARHRQQLFALLKRIEAETRPGRRGAQGAIKSTGLAVAHALLFDFLHLTSGRCDPGYETMARAACVSRDTAIEAIKRLAAAGVLMVERRTGKVRVGRRLLVVRRPNGYAWRMPDEALVAWERQGRRPKSESPTGSTESSILGESSPWGRRVIAAVDLEPPKPAPAVRSRWTAPDPVWCAGRSERLRQRSHLR